MLFGGRERTACASGPRAIGGRHRPGRFRSPSRVGAGGRCLRMVLSPAVAVAVRGSICQTGRRGYGCSTQWRLATCEAVIGVANGGNVTVAMTVDGTRPCSMPRNDRTRSLDTGRWRPPQGWRTPASVWRAGDIAAACCQPLGRTRARVSRARCAEARRRTAHCWSDRQVGIPRYPGDGDAAKRY